jgi:hypothetical protein
VISAVFIVLGYVALIAAFGPLGFAMCAVHIFIMTLAVGKSDL